MGFKFTFGAVSLLAGSVYAAPALGYNSTTVDNSSSTTTTTSPSVPKLSLLPISASRGPRVATAGRNYAPKKDLSLAWQTPNNDSAVSVGVSMQNSAVVLEDVDDVTGVDCTGQASVAVTFDNTEAFNEALTEWSSLHDSFVIITNHMGDCDTEMERSFFVADSDNLASYENNLTIIARAEKSDLVSTASSTSIDFTSAAGNLNKRGIDWTDESLTIAYNYSIPSDQTIVDTEYVKVVVKEAYVNNTVKYSGHAKWDLFKGVTEFYLDVNKDINHYADLDVTIKGPWSDTFSWSPEALTYSLIHIPGIITLGPSAGISFGGTISTAIATEITGDFESTMPNGNIHVDFVNWESSYSDGWETDHYANFNTTEDISLTLKPFIDFTVEFACKLFGGLIDLSTGVKAEPSFPFVTTASVTQSINTTSDTVTWPNSTSTSSCPNGLSEEISFQFDVIAFATKWIDITLYEYKTDLWAGCLDWLPIGKH